jgi:hypothetical protein
MLRCSTRPEGEGEEDGRVTATFTVAVDDLAEAFELSNVVFSSAYQRRVTVEERERRGRQMRERGGFQRGHRILFASVGSV